MASVPNLKTSRNEAISANSSHVKAKDTHNQASMKMEACLKPIRSLVELLPSPLQNETKEVASELLSKSI